MFVVLRCFICACWGDMRADKDQVSKKGLSSAQSLPRAPTTSSKLAALAKVALSAYSSSYAASSSCSASQIRCLSSLCSNCLFLKRARDLSASSLLKFPMSAADATLLLPPPRLLPRDELLPQLDELPTDPPPTLPRRLPAEHELPCAEGLGLVFNRGSQLASTCAVTLRSRAPASLFFRRSSLSLAPLARALDLSCVARSESR
mmetsp:Transcript_58013/g.131450  ORF Transcript_58013/g.131450 Transcript_58013/m.131450 type:complete len:204 (-) Transcript_58013:381-992(-)